MVRRRSTGNGFKQEQREYMNKKADPVIQTRPAYFFHIRFKKKSRTTEHAPGSAASPPERQSTHAPLLLFILT